MTETRLKQFLLRAAAVLTAALLFYLTLRYLLRWLLPFLIALPVAHMIEPAVVYLGKTFQFRRGFSALVLTLFLLFLLGGLFSLLATTLTGEAYALLEQAPELLGALPRALDGMLESLRQREAACPAWLRDAIEHALTRSLLEAGDILDAAVSRGVQILAEQVSLLPRLLLGAATGILAVYFLSASLPELAGILRRHLPRQNLRQFQRLRDGVLRSLAHWLRAEMTLWTVTFCELLAGFLFLRQSYALLLAVLITLVDALPVFGTGTILLPWAAAELLLGSRPKAAALGALYLLTLTVHNVLEPRLIGAKAGLPPIASLMAMYLGFCSFGVLGMVLFPFLLLLASQLIPEFQEAAA